MNHVVEVISDKNPTGFAIYNLIVGFLIYIFRGDTSETEVHR